MSLDNSVPKFILVGGGNQGRRILLNLVKSWEALEKQGPGGIAVEVVEPNSEKIEILKRLMHDCAGQFNDISIAFHQEAFDEYLEENEIFSDKDVVYIAVPNSHHHLVYKQAARLGCKNIVLEKPVANTLENAADIYRLSKTHSIKTYIMEQYLFSTAFEYAQMITRDPRKTLEELIPGHQSLSNSSKIQIIKVSGLLTKDRRDDVLNGRNTSHIAEIELPHFLAIFDALFGDAQVFNMTTSDMTIPEYMLRGRKMPSQNVLRKHGSGLFVAIYKYQGKKIPVTIYTSLQHVVDGVEKIDRWFEFKLNNGLTIRFFFDKGEHGQKLARSMGNGIYSSQISIFNPEGKKIAEEAFMDNYLKKSLQQMLGCFWLGAKSCRIALGDYEKVTRLIFSLVSISGFEPRSQQRKLNINNASTEEIYKAWRKVNKLQPRMSMLPLFKPGGRIK